MNDPKAKNAGHQAQGRSAHSRRVVLSLSVLPRAAGYLKARVCSLADWHLYSEYMHMYELGRPARGSRRSLSSQ